MNMRTTKPLEQQEENRRLPSGWRWVRMKETGVFEAGGTPAKERIDYWNGDIPFVTGADITELCIAKANARAFLTRDGLYSGKTAICEAGTVIIVTRTRVGRAGIAQETMGASQDITAFRCGPEIHQEFLCRYLHNISEHLIDNCRGATIQGLTREFVDKLEIPLPPLPEQRRIAAVLREQMAVVEKARTAAQARLEAVKALPAAFLRQVFPQPGQPLPAGWRWVRLGEVCRDISDGTHFTPTYVSEGVPFLSVKDVREERISFIDCRYITKEQHHDFCRRCKPEQGDVLYTKVGTTGIAKAIDVDVEFSIFVSVALLKLQSTIIPNYLEKVLNAPLCRTQAENLTKGMANRNLVLKDLKLILLPLPPLSEQRLVAAVLQDQMATLQKARTAVEEELAAINALSAALLRRAFSGEL